MPINGPATGFKLIRDTALTWGNNQSGIPGLGPITDFYTSPQLPLMPVAVKKLSMSISHLMALGVDQNIYVTGVNTNGGLGDGTVTSKTSFTPVTTDGSWIDIEAGAYCSFAIKNNNTLWATGKNHAGQLGLNDTTDRSSWTQVGSLTDWKKVAATKRFGDNTYALKADGSLWGWGYGGSGSLLGSSFVSSPLLLNGTSTWVYISTYGENIFAIKSDGTLWAAGKNFDYNLGDGTNTDRSSLIQIGSDSNWSKIATGTLVTAGIKTDGTIWVWGYNGGGALGLNNTTTFISTPVQQGSDTNWYQVACGSGDSGHMIATRTDGTLWAWGSGTNGQLGNGLSSNAYSSPIQVGSLTTWKGVAVAYVTSSGIANYTQDLGERYVSKDYLLDNYANLVPGLSSPGLYAWGNETSNQVGRLGLGTTFSASSPTQIGSLTTWKKVSAGESHAVALKSDGTLWAWGLNTSGQLGLGDTINRSSPVQIGSGTDWQDVSSGGVHTLAMKTNGTIWAWGAGNDGQLGSGTQTPYSSPIQVGSLTTWKQIRAGGRFSLAIKTDGTLWVWGDGQAGQLGNQDTGQQRTPIQVGTGTDWKTMSGGGYFTLAIKTDGTFWAWGSNNVGQLGLGDNTNRSSPVQVGSDTDWKDVAGGGAHSLVLKKNGTLWSCGYNSNGQLGLSDNTNRSSPTQVGSLTNWKKISAGGGQTSMALRTDGTLYAMGSNANWALGLDNYLGAYLNSPTQVGSSTTWKDVSCGGMGLASYGIKDGYI